MLEIEQKFRVEGFEEIAATLAKLGIASGAQRREKDHYLNAPDRDFATTGEVFRIRRVGVGNYLTYRGPREKGEVKIRREMEMPLPPGPEAFSGHLEIFQAQGYRPVEVVEKTRVAYSMARDGMEMTVTLDQVRGLGTFVEVEALANPADGDRAAQCVRELARELGLTRLEPRSYLRMLLETGKP